MTYYPKASAAGAGSTTSASNATSNAAGVSASVKFPEIEERILKYWDQDGTFQASIDQRDAGQDGSATNSSSTTARPSPTACRTTATS